ncbi:hypothetical protein GCWU000325_02711 [Alloprevotella tannerae ATCC 51259]|uniref:Uncharacterized protein n=1 Tax=Alloprevotella tannerae ATCC 51259 TaxID=626522 RepID=C9LKE6_9BACT|nr:hypothetical protein GCWU000325_02711 [Alloprevotella tannerae ATCC 51259]
MLPANETRCSAPHSNISAEYAFSLYKIAIISASIVETYKFCR